MLLQAFKKKIDVLLHGLLLPRQVFHSVMCSDTGQDVTLKIPEHQTNSVFFYLFESLTLKVPEMSNWFQECLFSVCFTGWLFTGCQKETVLSYRFT